MLKALQSLVIRSIPKLLTYGENFSNQHHELARKNRVWKKFINSLSNRRRNIFHLNDEDQRKIDKFTNANNESLPQANISLQELYMDIAILSRSAFKRGYRQLLGESDYPAFDFPVLQSSARKLYDGRRSVLNNDTEDNAELDKDGIVKPDKETIDLIEQALERCKYLLAIPAITSQIIVLDTISFCYVGLLCFPRQSDSILDDIMVMDQRFLYPMLHKTWPPIVSRLKDLKQAIISQYSTQSSSPRRSPRSNLQQNISESKTLTRLLINQPVSLIGNDAVEFTLTNASYMTSQLNSDLTVHGNVNGSLLHELPTIIQPSNIMLFPPLMVRNRAIFCFHDKF